MTKRTTTRTTATPIRSTLGAGFLACAGLACIGLVSVPAPGAPGSTGGVSHASPLRGETLRVRTDRNGARAFVIETPDARASYATGPDQVTLTKTLLSSRVIFRAAPGVGKAIVAQMTERDPSLEIGWSPAARDDIWVLEARSVRGAAALAERIGAMAGVESAFVDSGIVTDRATQIALFRENARRADKLVKRRTAPGIRPYVESEGGEQPQGVLDPDLASQWHFQNTAGVYTGRDNNITPAIFDTLGFDGTGVTIGIVRQPPPAGQGVTTEHFERAHPDLTTNFNEDLSQFVDLTLEPADRVLTAQVGLVGAERDNGVNGHGIAPGARFATLNQGTGLQYSQMLEHEIDQIDIKVIPTGGSNSFTSDQFNRGFDNEFVRDSFNNALEFGRNGLGTVLIFSGGFSVNTINFGSINGGTNGLFSIAMSDPDGPGTIGVDADENIKIPTAVDPMNTPRSALFNPDFYDGAGESDILDGNALSLTELGDTNSMDVTNVWTAGPSYVVAQANLFPFASDRRTLLINAVSEDGGADMSQAIGPAVFASVYTGTSNALSFGDNPIGAPPFLIQRPRGVVSTVPGGTETTFPPGSRVDELPNSSTFSNVPDYFEATTNSATTAAGIVALMLDANPNLTIRDIQHILFESVFDSTRSSVIRFPNFNAANPYIGFNSPGSSFWQLSAAFRETPSGTVNLRHSDVYGFGMIDAELAVTKAATWTGAPDPVILDSGVITEETEDELGRDQMPVEIADATFGGQDPNFFTVLPGTVDVYDFCVRPNIVIEAIEVEMTIEGSGSNDLFIQLTSPNGTRSNLLYPTTTNFLGTTFQDVNDDGLDDAAFNAFADTAFFNHKFTTFKHWGELSGGPWRIRFVDHGPDEAFDEGTADDPMTMEDETERITYNLGNFGVPGSSLRSEKSVTEIRIRIFGYESGETPFLGCDPFITSCPGDLNGDGLIDTADLVLYLQWFENGDARADITGDGVINFFDLQLYISIFEPGFCDSDGGGGGGPPFTGGRPSPFDNDGPVVRPF